MHLFRYLLIPISLLIAGHSHNTAASLPDEFWKTALYNWSDGEFNLDRLAVSATVFSKALPEINKLAVHPVVAQYLSIPTITQEKTDKYLSVTAEHFGRNPKWPIEVKNSLLYNLTTFTAVTNLPTLINKIAKSDALKDKLGESVAQQAADILSTFHKHLPQTNPATALRVTTDLNASVYKNSETDCRNTLFACIAGQMFIFGIGNATYLLLSTESGESLIRKLINADNSDSAQTQSNPCVTALANESSAADSSSTAAAQDKQSEPTSATKLIASDKAAIKVDDRKALQDTKEWLVLGSQVAAAVVACKVLPPLVKAASAA